MAVTCIATAKEWLASDAAADLSPAARLTLVLLCEAVNESRVQAGYPWTAWPGQQTLALLVGITPRQQRRILRETLEDAYGVISDTGETVGRGIVKWEILEGALQASSPDTGVRPDTSVQGEGETGHQRPGARTLAADAPDVGVLAGGRPSPPEPEGNREKAEPESETGSAPSAPDVSSIIERQNDIFDGEWFDLVMQLDIPFLDEGDRRTVVRRLGELEGEEITMDMWARRLPDLVGAAA